jgi:valyl-tRNA synthetase
MMEISKLYDPKSVESKWYAFWLEHGFFRSEPDDREPYTVVIPPPNVTGVLHMGHMLNNTIQDVLVRKARMEGKNACWVPGVDHASIATEAKVVQKLRAEGIKKSDLTREEFLRHAWDWKNKHGGIILEQLKKLGAGCDWERETFTMDEHYSRSVIDTFIDLFEKGYIYRGKRMINWDPSARTALSDEEVIYKEVDSKLYHVKYKIAGSDDHLTIATTRPETILGDSAICVNPDDERYFHLHGKKAVVPLVEREVPIITDDYVDVEFGTGCLKITPAHDVNDYELGRKHGLETIDVLNDNGTMSEAAQFYIGEDRLEVRKKIAIDLKKKGHLVKEESYRNKVGYSERTDVPIEPRISLQWFVKMSELSKPALDHVMNDDIQFWPPKFKNSYRHWMENIKDWCISRQLWWGHQIPAYYYGDDENDFIIARSKEEALEKASEKTGKSLSPEQLRQDEDVLDTWFSSWLWPISVFNGFYDDREIDYYYPTNDLVTAPEIMFFWVARMIIAGYEYRGEKPFKNVYFTGIVRDSLRRKMSKSLGNSPDPIALMDQYGADGVRIGMLFSSPAGNDLLFDESLCEQGRNFSNKIWNALRLVKSWTTEEREQPAVAAVAVRWMDDRIAATLKEIDDHYAKFRISDVLMTAYKFTWNDFCSWYLEAVKPPYGEGIDPETLEAVIGHFEIVVKILHPLMPFITEEIWHLLRERQSPDESLIIAQWPESNAYDRELLDDFARVTDVVTAIRNIRKQNNIPPKERPELLVRGEAERDAVYHCVIEKLANVSSVEPADELPKQSFTFVQGAAEYALPFGDLVDMESRVEKIKEELEYTRGFLASVQKKLSNERFVNNAPDQVVANERKKEADAMAKIAVLEEQLSGLGAEF